MIFLHIKRLSIWSSVILICTKPMNSPMAAFQGYIILCLTWLAAMVVYRFIFSKTRKKQFHLPPSPISLPIIGHLHLLDKIPHQAFHKLSSQYGPLIHLKLGSIPCVVASSPEVAKEFLKTHESSFSKRPQKTIIDYLTYGSKDFTFAPYGPYWKFMKKLCMSELLGSRTLDQLLPPIRSEEINNFVILMLKKAEISEAVDVGRELVRLVYNIISRMTVSQRSCGNQNEGSEVIKLVKEAAELVGRFNLSDYVSFCRNLDLQGFGKRVKEVRKNFDSMMDKIIKEHEDHARDIKEKDNAVKDLLDILLDISEDKRSEIRLTKENIKSFILDIFVAGSDTSAITIEWALAELINHPSIMIKARDEIDFKVGKTRTIQESDIANLPYIQAIVKETLRLHPPGPLLVRESSKTCTINGYDIPEKTNLFVNVWAIGRDPKQWENPLVFKPERFIAKEENGKSPLDFKGQNFQFLPFGSGRRGCPGTSLGLQVVHTTLATMIQCFEWKVEGGNNGTTVNMEEGLGFTLPRAHPLVCVPKARLDPFPISSKC